MALHLRAELAIDPVEGDRSTSTCARARAPFRPRTGDLRLQGLAVEQISALYADLLASGLAPAASVACCHFASSDRAQQVERRLAWRVVWVETGLVFGCGAGEPIHPRAVFHGFGRVARRRDYGRSRSTT